jgi:DNA-binding NtrC family response regulator
VETELEGKTALIVDDDELFCDAVADYLSDHGMRVLSAHTGQRALELGSSERLDVVLLDQRLPDSEGQQLCPSLHKTNEQAKIIFITAHATFDAAVSAIRAGAHDYLSKPVELEELLLAVKQALRVRSLERVDEVQQYRRSKDSQEARLIGADGGLAEVDRLIALAASSDAPVLITGETGTGKNVVAKNIHYRSQGRAGPMIPINCAALPENLIESELFGYEKGAFTGAEGTRKGVFEMAEGGTLFLDEIGEMPSHLQSKLLSALEDRQVKRLGGETFRPVDVRIIAATANDLDDALGVSFREDLYYRLSVIRIHLPPLRERLGDLPALAAHILGQGSLVRGQRLSDEEIQRLSGYTWPGNVRELKNVLERAALLQSNDGELRPSELLGERRANGPTAGAGAGGATGGGPQLARGPVRPLRDVEREYIQYALRQSDDNYTRTARQLGIALSTLKRKLRNYGMR